MYRKEYPRAQWVRKDWLNLNGTWDFCFDDEKRRQPLEQQRLVSRQDFLRIFNGMRDTGLSFLPGSVPHSPY